MEKGEGERGGRGKMEEIAWGDALTFMTSPRKEKERRWRNEREGRWRN